MGDLPPARVTILRPFTYIKVDFTGAITVKCVGHRSVKFNKMYACIFVCMPTKAVHIKLANDLSTEAFLAIIERFVARRGKPLQVNSDNATNFLGMSNLVQYVHEFASVHGIEWRFISPRSPHQGWLWVPQLRP